MKGKFFKTIIVFLFLTVLFFFGFAKGVKAGCSFMGSWPYSGCPTSGCYEDYPCWTGSYVGNATCWYCIGDWLADYCCDNCGQCGGGCFVEGTEVDVIEQESERAGEQESSEAIENLEPGDIVSSFNPETGEVSESQVAEVHKITREGYYELETESGKKVKVTGEHPFLAIKAKNFQFPISNFQLIDKLKNVLSNTLTFRLIATLQTKFF